MGAPFAQPPSFLYGVRLRLGCTDGGPTVAYQRWPPPTLPGDMGRAS